MSKGMRQSNIIYIDQMLYAFVKVIELIETDTHYQLPLSFLYTTLSGTDPDPYLMIPTGYL